MSNKARYWIFIAYPESMPDNWLDILTETRLPIYISPLHNLDVNSDGTQKKPHYHIIVCFDGPTTYNNVNENICIPINATIPKICLSLRGSYDYFVHLHNKDKTPYDKDDIIYLNGASEASVDLDNYIGDLFIRIQDIILYENIKSIKALTLRVRAFNNLEMDKIVRNNVYFWKEFMSKF